MSVESTDRRAVSHMNSETKEVHVRLEAWAPWAKDSGIAGFPPQSLTEKAAKYGKLGIPQQSLNKPEPMMPVDVAITDAAISRLGAIDQKVIRARYLYWESREISAKRCGMRQRQFDNVLKRARWRVGYYIKQGLESAINLS